MNNQIYAVIVLGGLGLFFGIFLTYFFVKFRVEENPLVGTLLSLLPKANCGACGAAGCSDFAEQLAAGKISPAKCVALSPENRQQICRILGLAETSQVRQVARVFCSGGTNAVRRFQITTLKNCRALKSLFDTNLACSWGCLGLGSCAQSCPFGAIRMNQSLPEIDEDKCVGCGRCVDTCPQNIIKLVPLEKKVYVACSCKEKGPTVIKICRIGCIGCGRCVKSCPKNAIVLRDNLAIIDPLICDNCGRCVTECPRKVIFVASEVSQLLA